MIETIAWYHLGLWQVQNQIETCDFVSLVGHKHKRLTYGMLLETNNGYLFQQHKWAEVNKKKEQPKICAETVYTHKAIPDLEKFWSGFDKISTEEHTERWIEDMQSV